MKSIFNKSQVKSILYTLLFAILLTFLIETLTRDGLMNSWLFVTKHFSKFSFNILVVFLTLTPIFLFKRRIFAVSLISTIWIFLSIADNLVIKFRGTPLTGADLGMIKEGFVLAKDYLSPKIIVLLIIIIGALIFYLVFLYIKSPKVNVNYRITLPFVLIFILIFPNITNFAISKDVVTRGFWDVLDNFSTYGFPFSFLNSVVNTGIKKPSNYNEDTVLTLKEKLSKIPESNTSITKPNIILIQLESFFDPTWINGVTYNFDPIPNFRMLYNNFSSGLLKVPALGGGTANTEFEVVTGMSTKFFGAGEFPFNTILAKKTLQSYGYLFDQLGYGTHAIHNHEGKFYNRDKVYPNLFFDTFTALEDMGKVEKTPIGWAKDYILLDVIKENLLSTNTYDFIYTITVQSHGAYPNDPFEGKTIEITSSFPESHKTSFEYYLMQIHEVDIFIGNLINMVKSLNEPTIVAMFGDHLPGLGIPADSLITNDLYSTPYVIWDNLGLPKIDQNLHTYQLMAHILEMINIPGGPVNTLHTYYSDSPEYMDDLNLLQYDILYGKNYINE